MLLLLDRVSAVNATDPSIALIDRLFLINLNARQVRDFSTAYSCLLSYDNAAMEIHVGLCQASSATFNRMVSKNFPSLLSRTYSQPQFQNVTTAVECSAMVLL